MKLVARWDDEYSTTEFMGNLKYYNPAHLEVVVVVYLENAPYLPQRRTHRLSPLAVATLKDL